MYQADTRRKILSFERQYRTSAERMTELRLQEDLHILKDAQVVGMTTTGKKTWANLPAPVILSGAKLLPDYLGQVKGNFFNRLEENTMKNYESTQSCSGNCW